MYSLIHSYQHTSAFFFSFFGLIHKHNHSTHNRNVKTFSLHIHSQFVTGGGSIGELAILNLQTNKSLLHCVTPNQSSSSAIAFLSLPPVHPPSPTNIFLANFPKSWSEFDLAQIFDGIPILTVHVIRDRVSPNSGGGVSRGVGFVNVLYKHEAVALVQHLDRKIWLDVEAPLKIRLAKATAPHPKVEFNVNGMMDSSNRAKDCEFSAGRGPKVNLLKELDLVISAMKKPLQKGHSVNPSTSLTPDGLYNLWAPIPYKAKCEFNGLSSYTKMDTMSSPNESNRFCWPINRGCSNPWVNTDVPEPYPNQWELWQTTQNILEPVAPWQFALGHQMRSDSHSEFFLNPATPSSTDSVTEEQSPSFRGQSPGFDYGFIGGPAVDISSGTVISPRRCQRNSSPMST